MLSLVEQAIRFCQMTKEEAMAIDPDTLKKLVQEAKKQWYKTLQ